MEERIDYFGNLEFLGVELEHIPGIRTGKWSFSSLEKAFETNGILDKEKIGDKNLWMWMIAEPNEKTNNDNTVEMINVPVCVVAKCEVEPFTQLSCSSIQGAFSILRPLRQFHFEWFPFFPNAGDSYFGDESLLRTTSPPIFKLHNIERKAVTTRMSEAQIHHKSLLLASVILPKDIQAFDLDQAKKDVKNVDFFYNHTDSPTPLTNTRRTRRGKRKRAPNSKHVHVVFEKGVHSTEVEIPEYLKELGITGAKTKKNSDDYKRVWNAIHHQFNLKRQAVEDDYNRKKAFINSLPQHHREALDNMEVIKFYPDDFSCKKSNYVSRDFPKASQVFPQPPSFGFLPPSSSSTLAPPATVGFKPPNLPSAQSGFSFPSTVPPETQGFVFQGNSTSKVSGLEGTGWVCQCCEQENDKDALQCSACMVKKQDK